MKQLLTELRSSLMFITILPAGKNVEYSPLGMIKFFPVVGLIIGALLVLIDRASSLLWPDGMAAVLDTFFLVVVTGAFHLDGLGDAADGIFSHRSRERALEIMKDSRSGMMGLVAVICSLGIKTAGIYSMKLSLSVFELICFLLIVPAYARAGMIFGIDILNYGRKNQGTGLDLFEKPLGKKDYLFFLIPVVISLFLGFQGLILNLVFFVLVGLILLFYKRKMGCITGDMLGAMTEVTETILFVFAGITLF